MKHNLIPKKIYDASNPTRLSETIHWRTVSELIKYNEIRGLISGEIIPQHKIGIVDSACDVTRDYISCPEWGKIGRYTYMRNPCSTEITSVISEVNITKLSNYKNLIGDILFENEIKISLGLNPMDSLFCNSLHLQSMDRNLSNPKVVALGNVGLDTTINTPMSSKVSVLKTFLQIAKKPIRVFSKGCHSQLLDILKESLEEDHKIHYTNTDLNMGEALELLIHFNNSFIGISRNCMNAGNPVVEMIKRLSLSTMIPSSYAFTNIDGVGKKEFDMEIVVQNMARLRNESRNTIAKQVRKNIIFLYQLHQSLKDPLELFMRSREFLPASGSLFLYV